MSALLQVRLHRSDDQHLETKHQSVSRNKVIKPSKQVLTSRLSRYSRCDKSTIYNYLMISDVFQLYSDAIQGCPSPTCGICICVDIWYKWKLTKAACYTIVSSKVRTVGPVYDPEEEP